MPSSPLQSTEAQPEMKKPSSKIREEITRLQEQLKAAETREAERIGRIALRAGLGEIEIEESELLAAFEDLAGRFHGKAGKATGRKGAEAGGEASAPAAKVASGAHANGAGEV
ncbi:uncharacterized protein YjbJ (UPF0337 family) [Bradyrhizobium japonicum]|nr:uncharacterized protein YjbJ (UPF0337 family) [Bradyrhizobium japonicum]MCP1794902.1 uncharacterized protein YjbJ (UPF0337 family) [Bradyrhizobium japonicum]MCP1810827.1 uncharacterized protein YjbJ (UPF0337 family) [Bradyrhizobium japonicum]MCP1821584.1 uncharacterized protein YjbJ (UPF0337 family) [Bradyrhizobium japonicum]MCP1876581.1 uncharacterized protein YjbJ (UPF0337 family) [Bradyrhizobium japonicum]